MDNKRELKELQTFRIVIFCFLVIMMEGFDIQAAGISAPKLAPALGLQPSQLGLFFSASAVGVLLFAAIGGILADRFGRKPVIIAATFAFGFFCLLTPQCTDISALVVVRFLTGAGLGAAMPVVIAMTSDHSPAAQKKRYVGIVYCSIAFGGMLAAGVVATGILGNGWSQVFYVGGVVPILICHRDDLLPAGVEARRRGAGSARRQLLDRRPWPEEAAADAVALVRRPS